MALTSWSRYTLPVLLPSLLCITHGAMSIGMKRRTNQQKDEYLSDPPLQICEDLIIKVTSIQSVCDSPQTFYYGNGVNRNSRVCNYGDKLTTTVYFDVTENLDDTRIYVVMSIYAGYGNEVLTATSPRNLKKYVGYSCNEAGSYSYTFSTTLSNGGSWSFLPYIQIAFSSETNGDYNLGAANIPCRWDNQELGEWTEITAKNSQVTRRDSLVEYGILVGTVVFCLIFVAVIFCHVRHRIKLSSPKLCNPPHHFSRIGFKLGEESAERSNSLLMQNKVPSAQRT